MSERPEDIVRDALDARVLNPRSRLYQDARAALDALVAERDAAKARIAELEGAVATLQREAAGL